MIRDIIMITGMLVIHLVTENAAPRDTVSKRNMGIFRVDHAPSSTMTLAKEAPFRSIMEATGNAPYSGPAAKAPSSLRSYPCEGSSAMRRSKYASNSRFGGPGLCLCSPK